MSGNVCEHCGPEMQFSPLHSSFYSSLGVFSLFWLSPWPTSHNAVVVNYVMELTWFSLWNFSKFPAIIGIGRDSTRTPATAHMLPNNFPSPVIKSYFLTFKLF